MSTTYSLQTLKGMLPSATVMAGSAIIVIGKEHMFESKENQTVADLLKTFAGYNIEVWGEIKECKNE